MFEKVLVAIFTYNEEKNISSLLKEVSKKFKNIIVVDNNSEDDTLKIVSKFSVKFIHHKYNLGKSNSMKTALDYARINQSIICQKLGVEHIIRTDDLSKKRYDIKQNLIAWLKKPHPGMIPILMAGDKKFLFHEKILRKKLDIPITFFGTGDQTENRPFYYFLAGAKYEKAKTNIVVMNNTNLQTKLNLGMFYSWNYLKNPKYFNSSFLESLKAYYYSFFHDHRYYGYFDYVDFKEENINNLISDFDLETDQKYGKVLWRMGDGQSSFNNLLYSTLCGFSEIDDYESTKVRLNRISRDDALKSVIDHNMPKKNNLEYFFSLIKIDPDMVFKRIYNLDLQKLI